MYEILAIILALVLGPALVIVLMGRRYRALEERYRTHLHQSLDSLKALIPQGPPQVNVDLNPLRQELAQVPQKVLQSIIGSTNHHKGALGELIGYLQLSAEYDRIIPLGSIVDFVAIKFPSDSCTGKVDFIDIKANGARLSKEQRALQELIEEKLIGFKKVKVETSDYRH